EVNDEELKAAVKAATYEKAYAIARSGNKVKSERTEALSKLKEDFMLTLPEDQRDEKEMMVDRYFHEVESAAMRACILDDGIRLDGRKTTDIRSIWSEVNYLPSTHGSAVFTRGETQAV